MSCRPRACGKSSGNDVVLSATTTRPRAKAKRSMNSLRGSPDSDSSVIRRPTPPATADWMRCILTRSPLNLGPKAFLTTGTPRSGTRFERSAPVTLGRPKVCDRGGTLVREALAVGRGQVDRAGDRLRVGSAIRYVSARCHGQHDCEKQCRRRPGQCQSASPSKMLSRLRMVSRSLWWSAVAPRSCFRRRRGARAESVPAWMGRDA
jgi:hypothetical protein